MKVCLVIKGQCYHSSEASPGSAAQHTGSNESEDVRKEAKLVQVSII